MAALAIRSAKRGSRTTKNGRAARCKFRWRIDLQTDPPLMSGDIGGAAERMQEAIPWVRGYSMVNAALTSSCTRAAPGPS